MNPIWSNIVLTERESSGILRGEYNHHNGRIWGTEQPHETVQHYPLKLDVFCAIPQNKMYGS